MEATAIVQTEYNHIPLPYQQRLQVENAVKVYNYD